MNQTSQGQELNYAFRQRDEYAEYVVSEGARYLLDENRINDISRGVIDSVRRSSGYLLDQHTMFAIEDTIREALYLSETFQRAVAFSLSPMQSTHRFHARADLTAIYYRNDYTHRDSNQNENIHDISYDDIITSNIENIQIIIIAGLTQDESNQYYVNIGAAPNYHSEQYQIWQIGLIHEIIHCITGSDDPDKPEDQQRLGPTEILAHNIARELNWHTPTFHAYDEPERNRIIDENHLRALIETIERHPHPRHAYALMERLYTISYGHQASENFSELYDDGISEDSSCECNFDDCSSSFNHSFNELKSVLNSKSIFCLKSENVVFSNSFPLSQWHLMKYNLIIAEKIVNRAESGSGFYKKSYSSWKEWYQDSVWKSVFNTGIYGFGLEEAEGNFIYNPYGLIFEDKSFSVGLTGDDVIKYGYNDNWTTLKGRKWSGVKYAGQMFFDKNGKPVAIVITNESTGFFGSGWTFIYKNGQWEYEAKDDWDKRRFANHTESLDLHAPRFLIKNV